MSLLKVAVKATVNPGKQLVNMLYEGIKAYHAADEDRHSQNFRVSSIGYCLRSTYYKRMQEGRAEVDTGFMLKVGLGTKVHELYQMYFQATKRLFGNRRCGACGEIYGAMMLRSADRSVKCKKCGMAATKYAELSLSNMKIRAAGHPDMFVQLGAEKKIHLVEIKTITPYYKIAESIENVNKYVPEHRRQANFYTLLAKDKSTFFMHADRTAFDGLFDASGYLLLYQDKGTDKPIAYWFDSDQEQYEIDKQRIQTFFAAVKAKVPPDPEGGKGCRYCEFVPECNFKKFGRSA